MPLWLTEIDVRALLDPRELIDAMESTLIAFSSGQVVQPVRTAFEIADRSFFGSMPAFAPGRAILGAKLVTVVPENAGRGIPTHLAAISLFDSATGELLAVMDGRYITEVRTAAVSAVSVRHLSRTDARVLAILGSAVQARSHLHVLPRLRRFEEIRAWSPNRDHLDRFAAESAGALHAAASAEQAVRGADIILIATNSVSPAIDDRWVAPGTHVISLGACRPTQREIDPVLLTRAHLFVDSRAAALQESGDVVQGIDERRFCEDHIRGELGEVAAGLVPGRSSSAEITLFKSLGLAVEDLTAAALAYRRAGETGRGLHLTLN